MLRWRSVVSVCLAALAPALLAAPAVAQVTTCKTSNCAVGKDAGGNPNLPAECQNRAAPRTLTVNMDSTTLTFVPANLRVEGAADAAGGIGNWQCIRWHKVGNTAVPWHSATDDTPGDSCLTATACSAMNTTPPCDWETGNIDNAPATGNLEWSVCHYQKVVPGAYHYRCRLHVALGMVGSFTLVNPIQLLVNKGTGGEAVLDWPAGGAGPWDVWRDTAASMPAAANLTPAGTVMRTFTDATALGPGQGFFYLVIERN